MKTFLLLLVTSLFSVSLEPHFRPIEERTQEGRIEKIDQIYLINLDHRVDRLESSLNQLRVYGLAPCRFPAIYGRDLSSQTLDEVGFEFLPGMEGDQWATYYAGSEKRWKFAFLSSDCYGKHFFSRWTVPGAVGCSLSHLSILQDAWDAGFETIWVLEDDFLLRGDPHLFSFYIDRLDKLAPDWDILYTDMDTENGLFYDAPNDFETDL
jgi:GR25 family glycosyltransferase involved in LPS biosynthesis